MNRAVYLILVLTVIILAACGSQDAGAYETVAPAAIEAGSAIPAPTEDVVLTISGNITITNVDETLALDMPTLEKLGLVKYRVTDPWLQAEATYTGVLLADVLKFAGASESVTTVEVIALNDYAAEVPMAEIEAWPVLLATQVDGHHMTIENNGPTRIIFPYDSHSDVTSARNMSVWNIGSLVVK
jgi:hypothetical protein